LDFGEPLAHEQAIEYICEAANAGIRTDLYTNGLMLNETSSQRLIESGLNSLFIRLDALDAETYARMHNTTPQTYEKILNNLETFLQLKKEHNSDEIFPWFPHVAAVMTLCEENKDQAMKFMEKYDRFNRLKNK
jgi:sulfatase maturation enzyme AslB (radical SAM superfamily)